jgi:serine/threonine protein kinase
MGDDKESIVITDFGLAGIQGQAVSSGALTVHISPPEVLLSPKAPRTQSCDVYAFGIVMLELLVGRHCFNNMTREAIKSVVVSEDMLHFVAWL